MKTKENILKQYVVFMKIKEFEFKTTLMAFSITEIDGIIKKILPKAIIKKIVNLKPKKK
jgi:hypothetical protein